MVARPVPTDSAKSYPDNGPDPRKGLADMMPPVGPPKTELARYRPIATKAGVRVSPLALGGMSLGDQWGGFFGKTLNKEQSFELLDHYYNAGGNFIDVASFYQDEQSEVILGEWMSERDNRDEIVVASKYSSFPLDRANDPYKGIRANFFGNHKKSMLWSLNRSLQKLKTDYIDIFFVHWWDHSTSVEELMHALHALVQSGKVHYLAISDAPAWIVAKANEYARLHALTEFSIYQGNWNVGYRDCEREIIPMCDSYGMAFMAWNVLGGGKFKTPEQLRAGTDLRADAAPSEADIALATVLAEMAEELGQPGNLTGVALAWARQKYRRCIPLVGGSKTQYLDGNIAALSITLTEDQIERLDDARPFDVGFPNIMIGADPRTLPGGISQAFPIRNGDNLQYV